MKNITWVDFVPFRPCYDPAKRYGEWSGTMLDLLNREDIPAQDRIWAFCTGVAWDEEERDKKLRLFACACARKVWHLITDDRSKKAIEIAELYAAGKASLQELAAAMDAARAAAKDAAMDAAMDAARDAARDAAMDAARDAAMAAARAAAEAAARAAAEAAAWAAAEAAAWAAAMDAARAAARDAARAAQIEIAKTFIQ